MQSRLHQSVRRARSSANEFGWSGLETEGMRAIGSTLLYPVDQAFGAHLLILPPSSTYLGGSILELLPAASEVLKPQLPLTPLIVLGVVSLSEWDVHQFQAKYRIFVKNPWPDYRAFLTCPICAAIANPPSCVDVSTEWILAGHVTLRATEMGGVEQQLLMRLVCIDCFEKKVAGLSILLSKRGMAPRRIHVWPNALQEVNFEPPRAREARKSFFVDERLGAHDIYRLFVQSGTEAAYERHVFTSCNSPTASTIQHIQDSGRLLDEKGRRWARVAELNRKGHKVRVCQQCAVCGRRSRSLKSCSGCQCIHYCSVLHQRADWREHKIECSKTHLPRRARLSQKGAEEAQPMAAYYRETEVVCPSRPRTTMEGALAMRMDARARADRGEHNEAIDVYAKLAQASSACGDQISQAECYRYIGDIYITIKKYDKAVLYAGKCKDIAQTTNNTMLDMMVSNTLADAYNAMAGGKIQRTLKSGAKRHNAALELYSRVLELSAKSVPRSAEEEFRAHNGLARAYSHVKGAGLMVEAQHAKAGLLSKLVDENIRRREHDEGMLDADAYETNGVHYLREESNPHIALPLFLRALDIYMKSEVGFPSNERERQLHMNMADTYHAIGQHRAAIEQFTIVLGHALEWNHFEQVASAYEGIGKGHLALENYEIALDFLPKARDYYRRLRHYSGEYRVVQYIGKVYMALGNLEEMEYFAMKAAHLLSLLQKEINDSGIQTPKEEATMELLYQQAMAPSPEEKKKFQEAVRLRQLTLLQDAAMRKLKEREERLLWESKGKEQVVRLWKMDSRTADNRRKKETAELEQLLSKK